MLSVNGSGLYASSDSALVTTYSSSGYNQAPMSAAS